MHLQYIESARSLPSVILTILSSTSAFFLLTYVYIFILCIFCILCIVTLTKSRESQLPLRDSRITHTTSYYVGSCLYNSFFRHILSLSRAFSPHKPTTIAYNTQSPRLHSRFYFVSIALFFNFFFFVRSFCT